MARPRKFWVIVSGQKLTAFRARLRSNLLPTLHQLQRKHPDTALMWFDGARFWESPAAARAAREARPKPRDRGADWRPGGDHEDPRAKYKQTRAQKRARFKKRLVRGRAKGPDEAVDGEKKPDRGSGSRSTPRRPRPPASASRSSNRTPSRKPRPPASRRRTAGRGRKKKKP